MFKTALEVSFVSLSNLCRPAPDFLLRNCTTEVKIIHPCSYIFATLAIESRNPDIRGLGAGQGKKYPSKLPLFSNIFS